MYVELERKSGGCPLAKISHIDHSTGFWGGAYEGEAGAGHAPPEIPRITFY